MINKKFLIIVNYLSFFYHRLAIANALKKLGYEVYICYGELRGSDPKFLESKGFKVYHLPMQPIGLNFLKI